MYTKGDNPSSTLSNGNQTYTQAYSQLFHILDMSVEKSNHFIFKNLSRYIVLFCCKQETVCILGNLNIRSLMETKLVNLKSSLYNQF